MKGVAFKMVKDDLCTAIMIRLCVCVSFRDMATNILVGASYEGRSEFRKKEREHISHIPWHLSCVKKNKKTKKHGQLTLEIIMVLSPLGFIIMAVFLCERLPCLYAVCLASS